ncbi:MAG: arylesterase [Candidatus Cyclobacteriaceae bacterium M2_1C_046]
MRRQFPYIFLLGFLILTSFKVNQKEKVILFYGDSLTAGYGLSTEEAFPAIVQRKIIEKGYKYEVINAGLSGETSAGGLARINWVLKKPVDIFILELGANDGLRGLPLEQTENNLQKIIDIVREKNPDVKVVIAGMMVPPNMGAEYSTAFQKLFQDLSQKNQAHLIPFLLEGVAGEKELNLNDGIHPNPKGHLIVADNVWDTIKDLL